MSHVAQISDAVRKDGRLRNNDTDGGQPNEPHRSRPGSLPNGPASRASVDRPLRGCATPAWLTECSTPRVPVGLLATVPRAIPDKYERHDSGDAASGSHDDPS